MCLLCEELWMSFEPAPQPNRQKFIADAPQPGGADAAQEHKPPDPPAQEPTADAERT